MVSFRLNISFASTCGGLMFVTAALTAPVTAMTNGEEDTKSVSSTPLATSSTTTSVQDTSVRYEAFKKRLGDLREERGDWVLLCLQDFFVEPETRYPEYLKYLDLCEKLVEERLFQIITGSTRIREPLDSLMANHIDRRIGPARYLTILACSEQLLIGRDENRFSEVSVMRALANMSIDQINALARNSDILCLKEDLAERIIMGVASKTPEEIDLVSKIIEKHRVNLFTGLPRNSSYEASIICELVKLPVPLLEKKSKSLFSANLPLAQRVETAAGRVAKAQKLSKKRAMKRKIQENAKLVTNQ